MAHLIHTVSALIHSQYVSTFHYEAAGVTWRIEMLSLSPTFNRNGWSPLWVVIKEELEPVGDTVV